MQRTLIKLFSPDLKRKMKDDRTIMKNKKGVLIERQTTQQQQKHKK